MSQQQTFPEVVRPCPKCGHDKARGPEYRRGLGSDEGLGEHLRFYCTVCRFMTIQPTRDQDTPERRRELAAAFETRRIRFAQQKDAERTQEQEPARDREIEHTRRELSRRRSSYGWRG